MAIIPVSTAYCKCGGIYLQMIVNTFLLIALPYLQGNSLLTAVVLALINLNFLTFFININPFFKFDGYWLFSDLFHLPNLHKKANAWLLSIVFPNRLEHRQEIEGYNTWALKIYSLLYAFFMAGILYILFRGGIASFYSIQSIWPVIQSGTASILTISKFIAVIVTLSVITTVLTIKCSSIAAAVVSKKLHNKAGFTHT
ncbi:MAG: hypothetical protein R2795_13605 [Saprospiraceae bacterium]